MTGCKPSAQAVGVGGLVLREQPAEHRAGVRSTRWTWVRSQAAIADLQRGEMPILVRDFEAAAFDGGGAIALAQGAPLGAGEGQPQRRGIRAGPRHGGAGEEACERRSSISLWRLRL